MKLKQVLFVSADGRRTQVQVPEDAPAANYHMGIVVGPPDLRVLGLPTALECRLHNELHDRGLLQARDIRRRPGEVFAALQAALRVDVAAIANIYEGGS